MYEYVVEFFFRTIKYFNSVLTFLLYSSNYRNSDCDEIAASWRPIGSESRRIPMANTHKVEKTLNRETNQIRETCVFYGKSRTRMKIIAEKEYQLGKIIWIVVPGTRMWSVRSGPNRMNEITTSETQLILFQLINLPLPIM